MIIRVIGVIISFSTAVALAAPSTFGEVAGDAASHAAEERVGTVSDRLELTDGQRPAVEAIIRESGRKREVILASFGFSGGDDAKPSRRQKRDLRDQLQQLSRDTTSSLSEILTEFQMAEWEAVQKEQADALRKSLSR